MSRTLLLFLMLLPVAVMAQTTATYTVRFDATWSDQTHPAGFPANPHFSGLIGASHGSGVQFWEVGQTASLGIKDMAERGGKIRLSGEVAPAVVQDLALAVLSGGGISTSPGSVEMTFDLTEAHPLVTLVSMLAPSPDWFVGVSGLSLRQNDEWLQTLSVDLFVYDAGTDSGVSYTAADLVTNPPAPISRIESAPFLIATEVPPVGRFLFTLDNVVTAADPAEDVPQSISWSNVFPNPTTGGASVTLTLPQTRHVRVALFDILGREVQVAYQGWASDAQQVRLETDGLPVGLYFLRLEAGSTRSTRSLVIAR